MNKRNKLKIINDPVYGFITIPSELIFDLIEHPYFQRLRRISQMGMSYLVYPGAHHTRFHHALGCVHLMRKAVSILRFKGTEISSQEEEALLVAILLHDIGHGPFSHAMEHSIIEGVSHETISLKFMQSLNDIFGGRLDLAIQIFTKKHPKKYLQQLLASQLDIDRLDYLKRDSFFTGVAEGNINSERIITMMNVADNELVIEEKGIYSVEKFLVARRLMYWQVYLHKTGLVAEQLLIKIFKRAKYLKNNSVAVESSENLDFFLKKNVSESQLNSEILTTFSKLDDYDVISAIKKWTTHKDFVLSNLCSMLIDRNLLKIKLKSKALSKNKIAEKLKKVREIYQISEEEATYFVFTGKTSNTAYRAKEEQINILYKNGKTKDVAKASDQFNLKALSQPVVKYYICYPKFYN
ncbi:HD domain-containing protein [Psychroflexus maritimus]|uniref:HD domain-containing protein n=1 Tax=Psychroflexus maritimus TaxID=2714865 RepID=A0A967ACK6_9FLAO|nr:HD domain-containing protein [Psychroflexus maritimus]NGZ89784.1 HD domain-containing protein [Psychroflexus maritimus]